MNGSNNYYMTSALAVDDKFGIFSKAVPSRLGMRLNWNNSWMSSSNSSNLPTLSESYILTLPINSSRYFLARWCWNL